MDLKAAFEQSAIGMFGYMTDLSFVEIDPAMDPYQGSVKGEDLESLLYEFLEDLLVVFSTEFLIFKKVTITRLDQKNFTIDYIAEGEKWDLEKHPQGQEIKAITYSNMQIHPPTKDRKVAEIWVILDI
uniref:Archease domain-containing protein n=1 Tax=Arcella intermedia TaxID=1963864 RepID=A0A6B2LQ63_9EUKA